MARHDSGGDPLRQDEARALGRARRRLSAADRGASALVTIAAVALAQEASGAAALALLAGGLAAISLPFGYAGYRLSRRYGLSRQTPRGWLVDRAKGALIGGALAAAGAAVVLALQRAAPDLWWLYAWAALAAVVALLALLWPLLLLPLFLRSEPLPEGSLRAELRRLVDRAGIAVRDLRLLHMGEKTAAANAMVAGMGPTRRIYVSDTLVEEDDAEALPRARVVLAHELGHQLHGDVWRLVALECAALGVALLGARIAVGLLAPAPGAVSALPATALGFALGSAVVGPLAAWYSRRRERAADAYAVRLTGEGETYARAMERLVAQNLMELRPPRLLHALTASHPAPAERIAAARGAGLAARGAG
jgi:STE24 endopeptidase